MTIELQDGSETTLGDMLDLLDDPPDTFESSDDLYYTLMSLAPQGSVGRANYDDREQLGEYMKRRGELR